MTCSRKLQIRPDLVNADELEYLNFMLSRATGLTPEIQPKLIKTKVLFNLIRGHVSCLK